MTILDSQGRVYSDKITPVKIVETLSIEAPGMYAVELTSTGFRYRPSDIYDSSFGAKVQNGFIAMIEAEPAPEWGDPALWWCQVWRMPPVEMELRPLAWAVVRAEGVEPKFSGKMRMSVSQRRCTLENVEAMLHQFDRHGVWLNTHPHQEDGSKRVYAEFECDH